MLSSDESDTKNTSTSIKKIVADSKRASFSDSELLLDTDRSVALDFSKKPTKSTKANTDTKSTDQQQNLQGSVEVSKPRVDSQEKRDSEDSSDTTGKKLPVASRMQRPTSLLP